MAKRREELVKARDEKRAERAAERAENKANRDEDEEEEVEEEEEEEEEEEDIDAVLAEEFEVGYGEKLTSLIAKNKLTMKLETKVFASIVKMVY